MLLAVLSGQKKSIRISKNADGLFLQKAVRFS